MNEDKFIEIAKKKAIINQLQGEVDVAENEIRKTFAIDVKNFFLSKGYEFEENTKYSRNDTRFKDLRQLDENTIFTSNPCYKIAGKNHLNVKFEWKLKKNHGYTEKYWYPEKQTLDDFYNRRLKKTLLLPIKVERKNKLTKIKNNSKI